VAPEGLNLNVSCILFSCRAGKDLPFDAGSPRMPEAKSTNPSKKKSQWNPGGFRNGNSDP
jgi:hypothetical protein